MPKTKTSNGGKKQKRPIQRRSQQRVAKIIAAAEVILRDQGAQAITFHAVAKAAEIPPSSVYQYFPTKDALFLALAQNLVVRVLPLYESAFARAKIDQWSDIVRVVVGIGREFYAAIPYSADIVLGSFRTTDIYDADKSFNERMARHVQTTFSSYFDLPPLDNLERIFLIMLEIADAIWATSMRAHGSITEDYNEEARRAMVSYLSNYFPPILPRVIDTHYADTPLGIVKGT